MQFYVEFKAVSDEKMDFFTGFHAFSDGYAMQ